MPTMRVLGIDPGEVRIGVAVSDETRAIAFPVCTLERKKRDVVSDLTLAIAEYEIDQLVVGLPLRLDGTEGEAARRARVLGEELAAGLGLGVVYWDERLTTAAAERGLRELGLDGRVRRDVVDQSAAALLLQSYLDSKTSESWSNQ